MSKKYDLKELHELTEKDREEIYRYAMKRSKEIVDGKSYDDYCTPIYASPAMAMIDKPKPLKLKEWNKEYGGMAIKDIYLIKRLKRIGFGELDISLILEVLENICTDCWTASSKCKCKVNY